MKCQYCNTDMQEVNINGRQTKICLHVGCIMDRLIERHKNCAHNLQSAGEGYLKCTDCGMTATPSYL